MERIVQIDEDFPAGLDYYDAVESVADERDVDVVGHPIAFVGDRLIGTLEAQRRKVFLRVRIPKVRVKHGRRFREQLEGRLVQMVLMAVRNEDAVDALGKGVLRGLRKYVPRFAESRTAHPRVSHNVAISGFYRQGGMPNVVNSHG